MDWLVGGLKHCLRALCCDHHHETLCLCSTRPECFLETEAAVRLSTTGAQTSRLDTVHCVSPDTKATEANELHMFA